MPCAPQDAWSRPTEEAFPASPKRTPYHGGVSQFLTKRRLVTLVQRYLLNPLTRPVAGYLPGWVLLETIGRRSGRPRRTPVGGRIIGGTLWIVSEHGLQSAWVRNIANEPHVRIRVRRRWRSGVAHVEPDDDPRRRALRINPLNGPFARMFGTSLLSVRVDLDTPNSQ